MIPTSPLLYGIFIGSAQQNDCRLMVLICRLSAQQIFTVFNTSSHFTYYTSFVDEEHFMTASYL